MKKFSVMIALVGLLFSAVGASATVLNEYRVRDNAGGVASVGTHVYNSGNPYGFWIGNSLLSGGGNRHFNLSEPGSFTVYDNGTASLAMSITNGIRSYVVSLAMSLANPPYGPKYPNATYQTYVESNGLLPWKSWEIEKGELSAGGTTLYTLGADPGTGGQQGVAANWINPFEYGFSAWIDGKATVACMYHFQQTCSGHVNMDVNVGLHEAPLPAGVALMLTGLGGLGLARRRKRKT